MLKKTNKTYRFIVTAFFLLVELLLFVLILWGNTSYTNVLEFSSVTAAFVFSLLILKAIPAAILTAAALMFTVCADFCLEILQPMQQSIAMTFFLIVQLCYFARLLRELKTKRWFIFNIVFRLFLLTVAEIITTLILKNKYDYLSCISILYYANLLLNVVLAFTQCKRAPLLAFGLLLFICCDTFVGLQCAAGVYLNIPTDSIFYQVIFPPFNIIWLFYVPAQVLLASSILPLKKSNQH